MTFLNPSSRQCSYLHEPNQLYCYVSFIQLFSSNILYSNWYNTLNGSNYSDCMLWALYEGRLFRTYRSCLVVIFNLYLGVLNWHCHMCVVRIKQTHLWITSAVCKHHVWMLRKKLRSGEGLTYSHHQGTYVPDFVHLLEVRRYFCKDLEHKTLIMNTSVF